MKTVLIVDDSAFMRKALGIIVSEIGFEVIGESANGKCAVERYKELNPDIVLLDVIMDEMHGINALKEIIQYDPKAQAIMVSAMGQEVIVIDAIKAGALDFVVKPFEKERIVSILSRFLQEEPEQ